MPETAPRFLSVVFMLSLLAQGCAGVAGGSPLGDGNQDADRRALQQLMQQGATMERPVDIARQQLEAGWIHRRFVENLAPQDVLAEVTLVPAEADDDERPEGFRVSWLGHTARRLASVGLRDGDVVLAINDHDVRDPRAFAAAIEGLRRADALVVDLLRDGQPVRLSAEVRDDQP